MKTVASFVYCKGAVGYKLWGYSLGLIIVFFWRECGDETL